MLHVSSPHDVKGEASPDFPTREEIELAEQLRRELEERYLGSPAPPSSEQNGPAADR